MLRKLGFWFSMGFALLLGVTAYAQGPGVQNTDPFWEVSYWNNTTLSGNPVVQGTDAFIDWDWGTGSPNATVNADRFSARWTRYIEVGAGTYRFTTTSDDGIRVRVDDRTIIDQWNDHPAKTFAADINLVAGHHLVVVEYYENSGLAVAKLSWGLATAPISGWRGEYFSNRSLSGSPAVVRDDANVDFNWGTGSPAGGIPSDGFSARWTRTARFEAGSYRFTASADDGVRLWVNNQLLVDQWRDQAFTSYSGTIFVSGDVPLKVEYYENGGVAAVKLSWALVAAPISGWRGEYFSNRSLSGSPALVRDDANVDFNWGTGSPAGGIPSDGFSARWTRTARFEAGSYRFTASADDGVRLWVNNHLLIDQWRDQAFTSYSGTIFVSGDVPLKVEYYENGGIAAVRLTWARADGTAPPPANAIIVDQDDPGFAKGGRVASWRTGAGGYDGSYLWTWNNDRARSNYNWARWYPDLQAGRYEVFVYVPERNATTINGRYWIAHADGFTLRQVNQGATSGWVSLGTYRFRGGDTDYVSLSDVTYESYLSHRIGFDAVKWEPR